MSDETIIYEGKVPYSSDHERVTRIGCFDATASVLVERTQGLAGWVAANQDQHADTLERAPLSLASHVHLYPVSVAGASGGEK